MFSPNTWSYFLKIIFSPEFTMNMKIRCISFTSLYGPWKYLLHSSQALRLESTLQLCHSLSGKFSNIYNSSEKLNQYFSPSFIQLSVPKHYRWHCHSTSSPVLQLYEQAGISWVFSSQSMSQFPYIHYAACTTILRFPHS